MSAYRTPNGRDPGRLIRDYRPADSRQVVAAVTLTFALLVALYSVTRPPRTGGHWVLIIGTAFVSLVTILQLLFPPPTRVRIFEQGVAITRRDDHFVEWGSVVEVLVLRAGSRQRRHMTDVVTLRLKNGTNVRFELMFSDNEPILAELRERTRPNREE